MATFDFTALAAGVSALTLANAVLFDSNGNLIQFATSGGSVTVQPATSVPEPAAISLLGFGLAGLGFMRRRKAA